MNTYACSIKQKLRKLSSYNIWHSRLLLRLMYDHSHRSHLMVW